MRAVILCILVALSLPFVWRRPLTGIIIYLAANIVRPEMLLWGKIELNFVFSVYYASIVLAFCLAGRIGNLKEALNREFVLMVWMLLGIYLSIHLSQYYVIRQYYYALELVKVLGLCALLYGLVREAAEIEHLQSVLLGCITFLGLWGIEQQFRGNERLEGLGGRAWGDSNCIAAIFVLFLPVALAKAFRSESRREFWISVGMAAVMVALIICTKSRGGGLGLVICLVSFGFYARKSVSVVKVVLVLALLASFFATDSYQARMKTMMTTDTETVESSARSRLVLWRAGLMVFSDNRLFGTGFLTFPQAKMKYERNFDYLEEKFRKYVFRLENKKVIHNTYLQMLSDCGVIGGVPFILLIAWGIRAGFKARAMLRQQPHNKELLSLCGLCAGLTGYAVSILTIDSVLAIFMYIQMACIGILYRMATSSATGEVAGERVHAEGSLS